MTPAEAVKQFTPFIWKMAKRFARNNGVEFDDLVQVGSVAVAEASKEWRADGGASMLTWIRRPVIGAMAKLVRNATSHGVSRWGGKIGRGAKVRHVSMDAPFDNAASIDLGANAVNNLHDVIGTFEEPRDVFALRQLPGALARLRHQERRVIRFRFVDGLTLQEIGERLGFSRERARQIEVAALEKLRQHVKGDSDVC